MPRHHEHAAVSELTHRWSTFGFGWDRAEESNVVVEIVDCTGIKVWSCKQTEREGNHRFPPFHLVFIVLELGGNVPRGLRLYHHFNSTEFFTLFTHKLLLRGDQFSSTCTGSPRPSSLSFSMLIFSVDSSISSPAIPPFQQQASHKTQARILTEEFTIWIQ